MIRPARPTDVPRLLDLIRDLACYEREPDAVVSTEDDLSAALFPAEGTPAAYVHVATHPTEHEVVGLALWFPTYSTWTGKPGIWLEDLYVEEAQRGAGHGKALLATLAAECVRRGWPRLDWAVLDWNSPSIAFYRQLGAVALDEWTTQRLTGEALAGLAASADHC